MVVCLFAASQSRYVRQADDAPALVLPCSPVQSRVALGALGALLASRVQAAGRVLIQSQTLWLWLWGLSRRSNSRKEKRKKNSPKEKNELSPATQRTPTRLGLPRKPPILLRKATARLPPGTSPSIDPENRPLPPSCVSTPLRQTVERALAGLRTSSARHAILPDPDPPSEPGHGERARALTSAQGGAERACDASNAAAAAP